MFEMKPNIYIFSNVQAQIQVRRDGVTATSHLSVQNEPETAARRDIINHKSQPITTVHPVGPLSHGAYNVKYPCHLRLWTENFYFLEL